MGDRPSMGWDAIPEGREYNPLVDNTAGRIVSPGYFGTIGVRIVAGRDFDASDMRARPLVMAINETFARRIQAEGRDPLRSRFTVLGNVRQVVAVVGDVKHRSLDAEAGREVYIPMGQAPGFFQAYDLVVRAADPIALVPSIRSAIWAVDSNQALGTPVALEAYISRTLRPRRLLTGVIGVFAGTTLLLAALGVYGVVRHRVAQQVKRDCDQGRARCTGLARHGGRAGRHNRVRRSGARRWCSARARGSISHSQLSLRRRAA